MGFRDLAAIELTELRFHAVGEIVYEDFSIDFWSMHGSTALEKEVGFFGGSFQHQIEFLTDQGLLALFADLPLDLHEAFAAALNLFGRKLFLQRVGAGAVLVGISERAHP